MTAFDPTAYGSAFAPLVAIDRCRSLGAGAPDRDARSELEKLSVQSAFAHGKVVDPDMAACCVSAVWLLHDFLDESHTISQGIDTPSGSFWHGITHRREGDFSNAKYWFRRVGQHEVFDALAERAAELAAMRISGAGDSPILLRDFGELSRAGLSKIGTVPGGGDWDPYAFVDLCQAAQRGQRDAEPLCRVVQQAEWELLFDYCYRSAVGD